jgi:hypothetical protein
MLGSTKPAATSSGLQAHRWDRVAPDAAWSVLDEGRFQKASPASNVTSETHSLASSTSRVAQNAQVGSCGPHGTAWGPRNLLVREVFYALHGICCCGTRWADSSESGPLHLVVGDLVARCPIAPGLCKAELCQIQVLDRGAVSGLYEYPPHLLEEVWC